MSTHHIFFESFEAFLAASNDTVIYAMPIVRTHPSQYVALVYSNIQVSQIHGDLVHHVILKVAERTEPDMPARKQEQNDRLDTAYAALRRHIIRRGIAIHPAIVAYPNDVTPVETYYPKLEAFEPCNSR